MFLKSACDNVLHQGLEYIKIRLFLNSYICNVLYSIYDIADFSKMLFVGQFFTS